MSDYVIDTNSIVTPEIINSLLGRQAATGGTGGLAASNYVNSVGGKRLSPYLQFSQDSNAQGAESTSKMPSYVFSGSNKNPDTPEQSWLDKVASWFTPTGESGASVGGNILDAAGKGVGALTGLAGMYYTKKNYDLQKDQANYLKGRDAASDARNAKFAANVGNGASY